MYIGFYSCYKEYNKNRMFTDPSSPIGDNLMYPFFYLGKRLKQAGHKVATIDTEKDIKKFDAVVFIEFPTFKNKYFTKLIKNNFKNIYLIAMESPIVRPDNINPKNHSYFKKIFTWSDDLINTPLLDGQNKKYFRIEYAQKTYDNMEFNASKKQKLCTVISSNKIDNKPGELYTERIKAIRWFEKHSPDDFDLYGFGWDRYNFRGQFLGIKLARLNRLKCLTKLLAPNYPSYKGTIGSKNETFKKYKFAVCYENCQGFNGYITEKIFDCFFAGCVPIYLGPPNINKYIPSDCFIDKRKFKTYQELYHHIKNMPEDQYNNYLNSIKSFLLSDKFYPFSVEYFADILIKQIVL